MYWSFEPQPALKRTAERTCPSKIGALRSFSFCTWHSVRAESRPPLPRLSVFTCPKAPDVFRAPKQPGLRPPTTSAGCLMEGPGASGCKKRKTICGGSRLPSLDLETYGDHLSGPLLKKGSQNGKPTGQKVESLCFHSCWFC